MVSRSGFTSQRPSLPNSIGCLITLVQLPIITQGQGLKDHARVAIQTLSPNVLIRTLYTHLGWRKHDGHGSISTEAAPSDR